MIEIKKGKLTVGFIRGVIVVVLGLKNLLQMFPVPTSGLAFRILLVHLNSFEIQVDRQH